MRVRHIGNRMAVFGLIVGIGTSFAVAPAIATPHYVKSYYARHGVSVAHYSSGGLQCVPFARENTGIELAGNAAQWWSAAEGLYQRGAKPEVGSVLNFRANGHMRMGHVAVVSNVIDGRNIEIDHANWAGPGTESGGISRNITVVDVSPANDWSAVRVALGHTGGFGSIYPTYGFIYDRPDKGVMLANDTTAPAPALNPAPRDLRPTAERMDVSASQDEEVAEAADDVQPRFRRLSTRRGARGAAFASHTAGHRAGVTRVDAHTAGTTPHLHHAATRHRT